jgi:hypothetical protein
MHSDQSSRGGCCSDHAINAKRSIVTLAVSDKELSLLWGKQLSIFGGGLKSTYFMEEADDSEGENNTSLKGYWHTLVVL